MKIDMSFVTDTMKQLIETPSPVGYYEKMKPMIEEYAAAFGMGVYSSHGVERTHLHGIENTARLMLSYVLEG